MSPFPPKHDVEGALGAVIREIMRDGARSLGLGFGTESPGHETGPCPTGCAGSPAGARRAAG